MFIVSALQNGLSQTTEIYAGTDANSFYIKAGETLNVAGLSLTPSSDFDLTNNQIIKATTVANNADQPYLPIVYRFANTTLAFSGSIVINYTGVNTTGFNESALRIHHHNGTNWTIDALSSVNISTDDVSSGAISNFTMKELTISDAVTALPLAILNFFIEKKGQTALLTWVTSQEQKINHFEVQHSADGRNFSTIGTMQAEEYNQSTQNYQYLHKSPRLNNQFNFYRIVLVDETNTQHYSKIIPVTFESLVTTSSTIRPNPAQQTLQVFSPENQVLQLISTTGNVVFQTNLNAGNNIIPADNLPRGIYVAKSGSFTTTLILN